MQVLPAIDIWDDKVVCLARGDFSTATVYSDDPPAVARAFKDQGAELLHVVDLEGARSGALNEELWTVMCAAGVRFQAAGGLRSVEDVAQVICFGATRAVLGSLAVWKPDEMRDLVRSLGADRVVAAIDVRNGRAVGSGWTDEGRPLPNVLEGVSASGVGRVLLTSIERDGLMGGPGLDLLAEVRAEYPQLSLISSGGVSTLSDLADLASLGADEAIVGRALYEKRFTITEALVIAETSN